MTKGHTKWHRERIDSPYQIKRMGLIAKIDTVASVLILEDILNGFDG